MSTFAGRKVLLLLLQQRMGASQMLSVQVGRPDADLKAYNLTQTFQPNVSWVGLEEAQDKLDISSQKAVKLMKMTCRQQLELQKSYHSLK